MKGIQAENTPVCVRFGHFCFGRYIITNEKEGRAEARPSFSFFI